MQSLNRANAVWTLITLLLAWSMTACASKSMKLNQIPLPPSVTKTEIAGAEKEAFNNALVAALTAVKAQYNSVESDVWTLPAETDLQQTTNFYNTNLKSNGFVLKTPAPIESLDSRIVIWEQPGIFGTTAVAVALIDLKHDNTHKFLLICTALK